MPCRRRVARRSATPGASMADVCARRAPARERIARERMARETSSWKWRTQRSRWAGLMLYMYHRGRWTGRGGSRHPRRSRLLELFFDFLQYSGGDRLLQGGELRQLTETQAQFLRWPAFRLRRRLTLAHRMAQFRSGGCVKAF